MQCFVFYQPTARRIHCIVVNCSWRAKKPVKSKKRGVKESKPIVLVKLGDYLQYERIKRGLTKQHIAKLFNVSIDTIIDWEQGIKEPRVKAAKKIIDFLGYFPFKNTNLSLGQQLYHTRLIAGKTHKQVAKIIGCDPETISSIESDRTKIYDTTRIKIQDFLEKQFHLSL